MRKFLLITIVILMALSIFGGVLTDRDYRILLRDNENYYGEEYSMDVYINQWVSYEDHDLYLAVSLDNHDHTIIIIDDFSTNNFPLVAEGDYLDIENIEYWGAVTYDTAGNYEKTVPVFIAGYSTYIDLMN